MRVIAVDLAGHGQSDKPRVSYTMDYFAQTVEAALRDAKVKRAVLVGHSIMMEKSQEFDQTVQKFLTKNKLLSK